MRLLSRYRVYSRVIVVVAAVVYAWPVVGLAGQTRTISPLDAASFTCTIHGDERSINLSMLGHTFGRAGAFFGVDTSSTADRRYLTSGFQWTAGDTSSPLLHVSAMRTEGAGNMLGGSQTLVSVGNSLDLGGRWLLPDLTMEMARVSIARANDDRRNALAARFGLAEQIGRATARLSYFRAGPHFNAHGSNLTAGSRGLELVSRYELGARWQFAQELRFNRAINNRDSAALAQVFSVSRKPRLLDLGTPWRITAHIGPRAAGRDNPDRPIALRIDSRTARWHAWQIDSSVGWYGKRSATPNSLPVQGTMWRVSASRGIEVAGFQTRVSPNLSLGGSRRRDTGMNARTGLNIGFFERSNSLNLDLDYLTTGWSRMPGAGNDLRLTLNFKRSGADILPGLRSLASNLRVPWKHR